MKPAMTPQQQALTGERANPLRLYKELAIGDASWLALVRFEVLTLLFSNLSGIVGFGARSLFFPALFGKCGKRPAIGRGVIVRQPNRIALGSKVLIDDYAALDVRGSGSIAIEDFVSIGRFSTITAKSGQIRLGAGVNVGSYCRIATQSKVEIGESTLIAAYAYIGPGNHQRAKDDTPLIERDMEIKGGVKIGRHCWIGSGALILDGVTIGDGAVIGAQSLVREDVPAGAVVVGTPARIVSQKN